jgi:thiol-disulfide isomerase/thioredoxin
MLGTNGKQDTEFGIQGKCNPHSPISNQICCQTKPMKDLALTQQTSTPLKSGTRLRMTFLSRMKEVDMKQFSILSALAVVLVMASAVNAQQPVNYKTAYKRAQSGDKPLLVLITAKWCPPCQVMKKTTIPELMKKEAFQKFHYATVDLDLEPTVARQLIGDRGVPQLIMFEKRDDKWIRRYLRGMQTPQTVEAFVGQAQSLRTASAQPDVVDK